MPFARCAVGRRMPNRANVATNIVAMVAGTAGGRHHRGYRPSRGGRRAPAHYVGLSMLLFVTGALGVACAP